MSTVEKRFAVAPPRSADTDTPDLAALFETFEEAEKVALALDDSKPLAAGEWCVYELAWTNLTEPDRDREAGDAQACR